MNTNAKYLRITIHILTQEYIEERIRFGAKGYSTFEDANNALNMMDTDDGDYEVCVHDGTKWIAVRKSGFIRNIR